MEGDRGKSETHALTPADLTPHCLLIRWVVKPSNPSVPPSRPLVDGRAGVGLAYSNTVGEAGGMKTEGLRSREEKIALPKGWGHVDLKNFLSGPLSNEIW